MNIIRGGIYSLKEEYVKSHDVLIDKRPIIALKVEKNDVFFSAVRMGIFKSFKDDENKIIIEINLNKKKYFSTVLCDKELFFPKEAVGEEIGILDKNSLKMIEDKLYKKETRSILIKIPNPLEEKLNDKQEFYEENLPDFKEEIYEENLPDFEEEIYEENLPDFKEEIYEENLPDVILNGDVKIGDAEDLHKLISMTQTMLMRTERKPFKSFLSHIFSFVLGVLASYIANNYDKEIGDVLNKCKYFYEGIKEFFL